MSLIKKQLASLVELLKISLTLPVEVFCQLLILAIWSASNGMSAIINSFNVAYDVEDSRNGVVVKLLSILYTLVLGAVFVVAVVLITLGPVINKFLFGPLGIDNQIEWIF